MIAGILLVITAAVTQTSAPYGEGRTVWIVEVRGVDEPIYGFVDDWDRKVISIEPYKPWKPDKKKLSYQKDKIVDKRNVTARRLKEYVKTECRKAGFEQVVTPSGEMYVSIEEARLAKASRDSASTVMAAEAAKFPATQLQPRSENSDLEAEPEQREAPGIVAQWWGHAVVLLIAVSLVLLTAKVSFR